MHHADISYYWIPNYLFNGLSSFSWMTWISQNNTKLDLVTGFNNGLGINPWSSFDWNTITYRGDPLVLPPFTMFNMFFGMACSMFMVIGLYWSNVKNSAYLPLLSNDVFDNTGSLYNTSLIVNNAMFNATGYEEYSQPYMSAGNMTTYFFFLASYVAGESSS